MAFILAQFHIFLSLNIKLPVKMFKMREEDGMTFYSLIKLFGTESSYLSLKKQEINLIIQVLLLMRLY